MKTKRVLCLAEATTFHQPATWEFHARYALGRGGGEIILPAGAWLLVLDSWGGFTGHGKGGVTIASDGQVFAHRLGGRANKDCRTRLTEVELQALAQAVAAARPSAWNANYKPAKEKACCDRFTWSLRFHQREADSVERITRTGWHDASESRPQDLLAVATIAQSVMTSVLTSCETGA